MHLHATGLLTDLLVDLLKLDLELLAVRARHGHTGRNMKKKLSEKYKRTSSFSSQDDEEV